VSQKVDSTGAGGGGAPYPPSSVLKTSLFYFPKTAKKFSKKTLANSAFAKRKKSPYNNPDGFKCRESQENAKFSWGK